MLIYRINLNVLLKKSKEEGKSKSELIRDALRMKMMNRNLDAGIIKGETVERLEKALKDVEEGRTFTPEEVRKRILE